MEKFSKTKAHTVYKTKNGMRVPGVTTVLGVLAKPALIPWAWNLGMQGIDYRLYRDATAEVGTLAHAMIAHDLGGDAPDLNAYSPEIINKAENALLSYYEWKKGKEIVPALIETSLVSELFNFGGTCDCLATINGISTLIDIKTGKAIYPEMLYQVAAYSYLLYENLHDFNEILILRVGRDESEGFDTKTIKRNDPKLLLYRRIFLSCLNIYNLKKELKVY